jgi:hypothetical protein
MRWRPALKSVTGREDETIEAGRAGWLPAKSELERSATVAAIDV